MIQSLRGFPAYGWFGLGLALVSWWMNWYLPGVRTNYWFFPLWAGYILFVDALAFVRGGESLIKGKKSILALLFFLSLPVWWFFELLNSRTQNWLYLGTESWSTAEYALFMSIAFSTIIPAEFCSANLIETTSWIKNMRFRLRISKEKPVLLSLFLLGWAMLALALIWPLYFYPFIWLFLFFIIEPINASLGFPCLLDELSKGNWKYFFSLVVGGLLCGFAWELWNYYSYPKWIYQIPFFGFAHIFEMPLLGYGGYPFFAFEIYAVYRFVMGLLSAPKPVHNVEFVAE
jgi:hypothetical protein